MAFERKKIRGEQLDQLAALVEPLLQEIDLDLPAKLESTLLVDEERGIYYLSFFTGSGYLSLVDKIILEKEGPYYFDGYENNPVTPPLSLASSRGACYAYMCHIIYIF